MSAALSFSIRFLCFLFLSIASISMCSFYLFALQGTTTLDSARPKSECKVNTFF